ncbi:MAG: ATP-binding protein, partial [Opitutaceae bacterium]
MKRLRDLPLATKLLGLTLLICSVAVTAALAACFAFLFRLAREHERTDLTAVAKVVAANAAPTFEFHDAAGARELLATLRGRREIVAARLLDASGADFANFVSTDRPEAFARPGRPPEPRAWWRLELVQPVGHPGEPSLGTLQIDADISGAVRQFLSAAAVFFFGILVCALALACALGLPLQRAITRPILALAETARRVAETDDYTLRVPKAADDEVGRLTEAFNFMLAEQEGRRELEKRLEQTQRLESLGVLAGGIAHDFNNILTGILCSASLARMETPAGSETAEHLRRIETSSRRAAELCEQMLAYAGKNRSAGGTAVHPNTLIDETLELLHASVPKDAELIVALEPDLPHGKGDPARVRQVLMNLVINAGEALRSPPRRISLSTRRATLAAGDLARMTHGEMAEPGAFVMVEVADTGAGIPPDQIRRIFEPFYTSKFTGRGLGLSSVLGIIHASGGALSVSSELGRGTRFTIALPVVAAPEPEPKIEDRENPLAAGAARGT